jgi:acyl-CoA synthetase (AMP-forming)/AMP-acid ligase II
VSSLIEANHRESSFDHHLGTPTRKECGSPPVADASGYLVCSNCGLIDEESILITSVEEPHYHKPSLRQRKALEREEEELEAKARECARRTSFREVQRLVEKYEERYGWRNAEAFVEKLSQRYPFLASALKRAPPRALIEKAKKMGVEVIEAYGMSKGVGFTFSVLKDHMLEWPWERQVEFLNRAGLPGPFVEVKIVDESGKEVPKDFKTMGEVLIRSLGLTEGYWMYEKRTRESWTDDGWFRTGDIGV